jgi:dienelactone hydrolase
MPRLCLTLNLIGLLSILDVSLGFLRAQELTGNAPIAFKQHCLNADSTFSAAGVMDVNNDGLLDIICGAHWYEAPNWNRHTFREVEQIRGRYDDYSNLTLDLDGDGLTDIVSVNYRSQSLYWCRNPGLLVGAQDTKQARQQSAGAESKLWEAILIDRPGKSETGRLVDIDGDGQLDILPAGTDFAAWYEVIRENEGVRWRRHELPAELIGHGIGWGDINGDHRLDLIGPSGWAEAPENPRADRWKWHPDFQLAKDCSIPIICRDISGDGLSDLVWSRGHGIGIYWTQRLADGKRSMAFDASIPPEHPIIALTSTAEWATHAIDTSWGSAHTLLQCDLIGDGGLDIVAGKRFQGHDGKDRGENDPLRIYGYRYDPENRSWHRQLVSFGGTCGIDLDSVCADLDGDGDIDIVAPSRAGLHWLENLTVQPGCPERTAGSKADDVSRPPDYTEHMDLSYYLDEAGRRMPINGPLDHGIRRAHILESMQLVMGQLPEPSARIPLEVHVNSIEEADGYWRLHLTYSADAVRGRTDRVPAYLLVPFELETPAPAMLCLHQTQFQLGKGEPCGLGGNPNLHFAHELAQLGFVCLAPDYPGFSEYAYSFEDSSQQYASGSMKGIWNHIRAVDLLESLPCVQRDAIGAIGHSLGGHNALFVAAMDQRISCVVTSCGFTAFSDYYGGDLTGWTSPRYMPRIASRYGKSPDQMPFDFSEVLAAIAPRPIFVCAPLHDTNFEVEGVRRCESAVKPVYRMLNSEEKAVFVYPDSGHDFPSPQREQAYRWLRKVLR